jgi:hypothetical protein
MSKWGKTVWKEIVVMENVLLQGIPRNAGHLIPTQPARSVQDNFRKKSCLWIVLSVLMLQFSPVNNSSRSAQCDSSILHTELPCLKPLLLVSCHFWPISVRSSLDAYRHISFSTFVRPKNEPTTNQGTLKSPRAGIRWPKAEPGSPPKIKMLRRRRLPRFTQWVDDPFLFVKNSIKTSRNHGLVVDLFILGAIVRDIFYIYIYNYLFIYSFIHSFIYLFR